MGLNSMKQSEANNECDNYFKKDIHGHKDFKAWKSGSKPLRLTPERAKLVAMFVKSLQYIQ